MKTIYLDTEFSEGFFKPISWLPNWFPGNKPRWSIELISIGLVDDQGKEYYAINKHYSYARCNKWVRENVLTKLPERLLWIDKYFDHYAPNPVYKTLQCIKNDILLFCQPELDKSPVQFKAYYADYDWVMICTIFGTMMDLPDGFPMYCYDIMPCEKLIFSSPNAFNKGDVISTRQRLKFIKRNESIDYPKQDDTSSHTALEDAKWNQKLDRWITNQYL